jgi:hypothetical protein
MRIVCALAVVALLAVSAAGCGDDSFSCADACKKIYGCGLTITVGGDAISQYECTEGCNEDKAQNPGQAQQALDCIEQSTCALEQMQACLAYWPSGG